MPKTCVRAALAAVLLAVLASAPAAAQAWPTKPVRILIGFASGGPADTIGRLMGDHLAKAFGQPFVVEPKPGAGGVVAGQILATAPPDGHTLYLVAFGIIAVAKAMYADMTYDPATDFQPVTVLVDSPLLLEIAAKHPVRSYAELIPFLKANTGKLNYGSPGIATYPHLVAELFAKRNGFASQHIPYRGSAPFTQGMAQGEIDWAFDSSSTALQLLRSGHVRILATSTAQRLAAFPDVPTLTELGVPDAIWPSWYALVTVAGTPRPIVDKLQAEIKRGWEVPENAQRLRNVGFEPTSKTPDETAAFFKKERETWTPIVKELGIKPQ